MQLVRELALFWLKPTAARTIARSECWTAAAAAPADTSP